MMEVNITLETYIGWLKILALLAFAAVSSIATVTAILGGTSWLYKKLLEWT